MLSKITNILVALGVVSATTFAAVPPANPNLISNPSVEANNSSLPTDWQSDSWGNLNASFTYANGGAEGDHSVRVDVSNYVDGDAKWYFKPVAVQAGQEYTYSTFYRASTSSEIVMQLTDGSGNHTYQWLKTVAPNTDGFMQSTASFTVPGGIKTATVFHVLNGNGYLQTDNFYFGLTEKTPLPPAEGDNLVPNQELETPSAINPFKPAYWNTDTWGSNTAIFDYSLDETGDMSARAEITNYQDGDAKWYFEPVAIEAGQNYNFKELYKANTSTEFVMAYIDASGNWSYEWLQTVPASASWKELAIDFTTPQSAKKATVFHVVNQIGWLNIDNARLTKKVAPTNPIPNPSLEDAAGSQPSGWSSNSWGSNSPSYEWVNEGHTGNKSVKVTVNNYVDGDAKWMFNPITNLERGKQYRFSAWYKTNTIPNAVVRFVGDDNTDKYFGMPNPQPGANAATEWQHYSDTFTVPINAKAVSVFFYVNKNGWVQSDDYEITSYEPVGFNRPMVTLTFDDGHEDNVANALPLLNQYGFKSTQCYATQHVEGHPDEAQNVLDFFNSGHEICSHTVNHPFLTSLNSTQLNYELQHSKQILEGIIGQPVRNFASPYGDYNAAVNNVIDNYYQSHRTVDEGYNSKDNFNPYRLRVQNVQNTTTLAEYQSWLDHAAATNTWLILVYHRVAPDAGQFDSYPADFAAQLQALKNSGLPVRTYQDALTEAQSQL